MIEIKKQKAHKGVPKKPLQFGHYQNCSKKAQLKNKIIHLEKNKTDMLIQDKFIKKYSNIKITKKIQKKKAFFLLKKLIRLI